MRWQNVGSILVGGKMEASPDQEFSISNHKPHLCCKPNVTYTDLNQSSILGRLGAFTDMKVPGVKG
jgi:hypothetical protein